MRLILIAFFLLAACASTDAVNSTLYVKRSSMWVPDLDRAIVFFRDVIGFEIESKKELQLDDDSVLFDLFNADPKQKIRRVLFSSPSQERVLFVMESADAPSYAPEDKRSSILLVRTDELKSVIARAKANGFRVGNTNVGTSPATGRTSTETTIIGPGGNAVLMYQTTRGAGALE